MPKTKDEIITELKYSDNKKKGMSEIDSIKSALVSMKQSKKESKDSALTPASPDAAPYPYGLRIRLENEDLKKLGITDLPDVGDYVDITAHACVTSVSQNESADSKGKRQNVELQIEDMKMSEPKSSENNPGNESKEDEDDAY